MKDENTTHFELWLAAYESHLVQLKQGKAPVDKKSEQKAESKAASHPPKRP